MPTIVIPRVGVESANFTSAPYLTPTPGNTDNYSLVYEESNFAGSKYPLLQAYNNTFGSAYQFVYADGTGLYSPSLSTISGSNSWWATRTDTDFIIPTTLGVNTKTQNYIISPYTSGAITAGQVVSPPDGSIVWTADDVGMSGISKSFEITSVGVGLLNSHPLGPSVFLGTTSGTWYNAFQFQNFQSHCGQYASVNLGPNNMSLIEDDSGNGVYAIDWTPTSFNLGGGFTQTYYDLQLSDSTDNTLLQNAFGYDIPVTFYVRSNTEKFYVTIQTDWPVSTLTCFEIEGDLSAYNRIDIVSDGTYGEAVYVKDVDGLGYLSGYDDNTFEGIYQLQPAATTTPIVPGQPLILSSL